jgi:hypothetical protein
LPPSAVSRPSRACSGQAPTCSPSPTADRRAARMAARIGKECARQEQSGTDGVVTLGWKAANPGGAGVRLHRCRRRKCRERGRGPVERGPVHQCPGARRRTARRLPRDRHASRRPDAVERPADLGQRDGPAAKRWAAGHPLAERAHPWGQLLDQRHDLHPRQSARLRRLARRLRLHRLGLRRPAALLPPGRGSAAGRVPLPRHRRAAAGGGPALQAPAEPGLAGVGRRVRAGPQRGLQRRPPGRRWPLPDDPAGGMALVGR